LQTDFRGCSGLFLHSVVHWQHYTGTSCAVPAQWDIQKAFVFIYDSGYNSSIL
jgi:hypothetical protein